MKKPYLESDVSASYRWLGHKKFTELNAFHPKYRQGREHFEYNRENAFFTKIWYARNENDVLRFIRKYGHERTVCYGINERDTIFKSERGFVRSAREEDITHASSFYFDFDFGSKSASGAQIAEANAFFVRAKSFFLDRGLKEPVKAYTGRGFHLLFAFPAIEVSDCHEIADRQRAFAGEFGNTFGREMSNLEIKLDSTFDLRRVAKIYGTAKPDVGLISRFYGSERIEDGRLREYLLSISLESHLGRSALPLGIGSELPIWFQDLLKRDERVRQLWNGDGKGQEGDASRSGYDFSLVRLLMRRGYMDIQHLATILAHRPSGDVQDKGKGEQYIKRTIANALLR